MIIINGLPCKRRQIGCAVSTMPAVGLVALSVFLLLSTVSACASINGQTRDMLRQFQALGEASLRENRFSEAAGHFTQALAVDPQDIRSMFMLGVAYLGQNSHSDALGLFHKVLQAQPNNIAARVQLSHAMIGLRRVDEAVGQLEWILSVEPGNQSATSLLADIRKATRAESTPSGFVPLPLLPVTAEEIPPQRAAIVAAVQASAVPFPPADRKVKGWKVSDFLAIARDSFGVALEYGKFCIETDNLADANRYLKRAESLASEQRDTRKFVESQIHLSLLNLYQKNIREFGSRLMRIRSMLTPATHKSFLEIYNSAQSVKSDTELNRLIGGVAMGAGHFATAARFFSTVLVSDPQDLLTARLLAEAQLENLDYENAESTLLHITRTFPDEAEGFINLARFYLTARFQPDLVQRYIEWAARISPNDNRLTLFSALLDASRGNLQAGLDQLRGILRSVEDQEFREVCSRILEQLEGHGVTGSGVDVAEIIALPGSERAGSRSLVARGEALLSRGSFFMAMKSFADARNLAEVGRAYLAIASRMLAMGEPETCAKAAGFGLNALEAELKRDPNSASANLYLSLYQIEVNDVSGAARTAGRGLAGRPDSDLHRRLSAIVSMASSGGSAAKTR